MPRRAKGQAPKVRKRHGIYQPMTAPDGAAAGNPDSMWAYILRFTRWQEERQYSWHTVTGRERTLRAFAAWCAERGLIRPQDVTKPILERWQRHLYLHRKKDGSPLTPRSQMAHTTPLKAFFAWLAKQNYILYNPASDLDMPRVGRRLPRTILTASEAEAVLAAVNVSTPAGMRDRAMLETLYSTGVRRQELIDLKLYDLDATRGVIMVREGKGKHDRMIPIGERAMLWIEKYIADVRPDYTSGADDGTLFLNVNGQAFKPNRVAEIARAAIEKAGIGKRGACHLFRHTMATLMLENGADIRFIQAMLGHQELSTTEIYTQVSIKALKAIHSATHPAKLPQLKAKAALNGADPDSDAAFALLDALDREAEAEAGDLM
jgi:integrase/recombinase XerD